MIAEDCVSFEIAKLLKEKRFDEECIFAYSGGDNISFTQGYTNSYWNNMKMSVISAPTLQMAMKWLREVHKWHIEISRGEYGYFVHIVSAKNLSTENYTVLLEGGYSLSYEEACEAAIKYCLENLI